MAYNTIASYRTAISEVHEHVEGSPVGLHPDISRMMHAAYIENPPLIHSDEPIDITPSLDYIKNIGDLSTILALGNWSSNSTYQHFYQWEIKLMLERNQVSKLILDNAISNRSDLFNDQ